MINFLDPIINTAQAVTLPTFNEPDLPAFISSVYSFSLTVVGIVVFVQILRAGFMWLTAAGNGSKASGAKSMMTNAISGAILLFAAYMILYVINHDLVKNTFQFNIPQTPSSSVSRSVLGINATNPTGGPAFINGVLRPGATSNNRIINVAQASVGIHSFTFRVVDILGNSCDKIYSIQVLPSSGAFLNNFKNEVYKLSGWANLAITNASSDCSDVTFSTNALPNGVDGEFYVATIQATGGRAPYAYSVVEGSLPEGLRVDTVVTSAAANETAANIVRTAIAAQPAADQGGGGNDELDPNFTSDADAFIFTGPGCTQEQRDAILAERASCEAELTALPLTPADVTGFYGQSFIDIRELPECSSGLASGSLCYNVRTAAPPNTPAASCDQWLEHPLTVCNFSDPYTAVACGLMGSFSKSQGAYGTMQLTAGFCIPGSSCGQEGCLP